MNYIFRAPKAADSVPFTYEGLTEFLSRAKAKDYHRKLGTTVEIRHDYAGRITVDLYETRIAELLSNGRLMITEQINSYPAQATTFWVQKVLTDNGIRHWVARKDHKYDVAGKAYERDL